MRVSRLMLTTLRDVPAEADIISHQLLVRGGFVKRLAGGIYAYMPLLWKVLKKITLIIEDELSNKGCLQTLLPQLQPSEIWEKSGRWKSYTEGEGIMFSLKDRQGKELGLGPTHEEVITQIISQTIHSYKQLPINIFQIQTKFRDEIRPRFGLMRSREFIMKDAYSFHESQECLDHTYEKYKEAYKNIFKNLMLDFTIVDADSGNIGGNESNEFHVIADTGEDDLLLDNEMNGMNIEIAKRKYNEDNVDNLVEKTGLMHKKGIEVGHIFYFGDKYSKPMRCSVDSKDGKKTFVKMGSYGIGVSRLVGAIIEAKYLNEKMKWPKSVSPFDVVIIPAINKNDNSNLDKAKKVYQELKNKGIDVLLDDVEENISNKFKKHDLLGVPFQIIIGSKATKDQFEFKEIDKDSQMLDLNKIIKILKN